MNDALPMPDTLIAVATAINPMAMTVGATDRKVCA